MTCFILKLIPAADSCDIDSVFFHTCVATWPCYSPLRCIAELMTACDDPFKRKLLESSEHRRVRWRNWSSSCKLYSILPICFFGEGYCQDRVQITCFKNKMHPSLVKRRVTEDDSNFFFTSNLSLNSILFFEYTIYPVLLSQYRLLCWLSTLLTTCSTASCVSSGL